MKELQLPSCALVFSILLCLIYFSKKKVKTIENKVYGVMLLMGTLDSLIITIERILVISGNINDITPLVNAVLQITNKVDYIALITLSSCLFIYTLLITVTKSKDKIKTIIKIISIINFIIFIIMLFLNVELITSGNIISVSGGPIIPAFITCGIYILLSIFITLVNIHKLSKKHIPIVSIIFIFLFLMFIFKNDPYIMIISIAVTFVNYLMYFTIENPDLKVVNELLRNRELVEKQMEDKSRFLFEMSQEIKTPTKNILSVVKNFDKLDEDIDKKESIGIIGNNANNILFKLNDILNISSMDASKIKISNNEYNTLNLFNNIKNITKNSIGNKNLKLEIDITDNVPEKLYGDDVKLKQIIMSVLFNSIENTKEGLISVEADSIVRYDVCRLIVKISDTGCGMSLSKINSILDDNQELTENDVIKLDELDMDLKATIKAVKLLGGSFNIKSEENKGSTFTIVIDQKCDIEEKTNIVKNALKYSSDVFGKKRILIVDDDKEELFKIADILSKYNVDINTTMSSKDCVDKIKSGELYNLIIVDDELKNSSAMSVLKTLKELKKFKVPVIVMLDKSKEHFKKYYIEDGFKDFIIKENITEDIEKVINNL